MLKSKEQKVNGNLYIFSKDIKVNKIVSVSLEKVYLKTINGHYFNEFVENLAYLNDSTLKINSELIVMKQPLSLGSLYSNGQWNGISITDLITQLYNNQIAANYTHSLEYLNTVGRSVIDELKSRFCLSNKRIYNMRLSFCRS